MIKEHYTSVSDFEEEVQLAQTAYCDIMAQLWKEVYAGTITECEYWKISEGTPFIVCAAKIVEATRKWDEFCAS